MNALATQAPYEKDSFGSAYDANASYPTILKPDSASSDVESVDGKVPAGGITLSGSGVSAFVPEGTAVEDGANKLTLTVTPLENTTSDITVVNNEILIPVDVHIEGVSDTNNVPIIIDLGEVLPKYLNMGNYRLFHVEDGVNKEMVLVDNKSALVGHNQFTYDSNTGAVSVAMASFSEVALMADTANEWKGEYDYKWYGDGSAAEYTITKADDLAALSKIVGGMDRYSADNFSGDTIKLVSDINLADGAKYDNGIASDSCMVEGTLITLADGTQKRVEELKIGDMVMIFNHTTGQYEAAPLIFNTHADEIEEKEVDVLHLEFSNGKDLKIVESHGLFDMTLMQYVYVNYDNYQNYVGHEFYALNDNDMIGEKTELINAYIMKEATRIFCPVTYFHMNSFANGFLNTPNIPGNITGLVNYFEYDKNLKYNEEAMERDIMKYGLYSYDDFKDYISEAAYNSSPAVYLKVAVGKGMITYEQILDVINYLLAGSLIE